MKKVEDNFRGMADYFKESDFWRFMGIKLVTMREGFVSLELPFRSSYLNINKTFHGGMYAVILDTTLGMVSRTIWDGKVATVHMDINFLRAVSHGSIITEGRVINKSRSTILAEAKLFDEDGNLSAYSTGCLKLSK